MSSSHKQCSQILRKIKHACFYLVVKKFGIIREGNELNEYVSFLFIMVSDIGVKVIILVLDYGNQLKWSMSLSTIYHFGHFVKNLSIFSCSEVKGLV